MDAFRRIHPMRLARGWSIYRWSQESDLPRSTPIHTCHRETHPSIATPKAICKAFGIMPAKLFTEVEEDRGEGISKDKLTEAFYGLPGESPGPIRRLMKELSRHG